MEPDVNRQWRIAGRPVALPQGRSGAGSFG